MESFFSSTVPKEEAGLDLASVRLVSKTPHSKVYVCRVLGRVGRFCLKVLYADIGVLEQQQKMIRRIMASKEARKERSPLPMIYGCGCSLRSEGHASTPLRHGLHIVSDWIEGASLVEIGGQANCLPINQEYGTMAGSLNILRSLADAVDSLGRVDEGALLVHGDLKPSNIIVSFQPYLYVSLIDLDTAAFLDDLPCAMPCGTFGYASPEAILAQGSSAGLGETSDVFSFGVVAHEVLCGRWPYPFPPKPRDRGFWVAFFGGKGEMAVDEGLPLEIRRFLSACLSPDPNARPSAGELRESLDRILVCCGDKELISPCARWADAPPTPCRVEGC